MDPSDVLDGYRHILKFMAEEVIDSPLNGGAQAPADWWTEHEQDIDEKYREEVRQVLIEEGRPFVVVEAWQRNERFAGGYEYVYDHSRPRLLSRVIKPTSVWNPDVANITLAVLADVNYSMAVRPAPGTTAELSQSTTGTMTYSATKDPADGRWRVNGYQLELHTTEAW